MKLYLASILLGMAQANYYSGDELTGVDDYADFCTAKGLVLADQTEWCSYAKGNPGVVYGMTVTIDSSDGCVDVEDVCGIPKPTDAPTPAPTDLKVTRGTVGRTRAQVRGGVRALMECAEPDSILCVEAPDDRSFETTPKASGSGDPHFKTFSGDKFDYHGECDLVLVDNPGFADGLGLKLHIRTTRVKYFSYIERAALQIGTDYLEFDNDVDAFKINGEQVGVNRRYHKTMLGGYLVRRDKKAISVRLDQQGKAKIDFHTRKNGFPAVIVDGGSTDIFKGGLGLLGEWNTGKKLARDGETEMNQEDATDYALEWQVRDTEPMLFSTARFPQFPTTCTPPEKVMGSRLGKSLMEEKAKKVCAHWKEDQEDCVFDVIATRDVMVAQEGDIVHIE